MSEPEFDWERALDALANAPVVVERLLSQDPHAASKAMTELVMFRDDPQIVSFLGRTPGRAFTNIRLAGEAVVATTRLLQLPPVEVMSGPIVRAGLIACGLILWLMDPKADPDERAARTVRVFADDINNARNLAQKGKELATPEQLSQVQSDIDDVNTKQGVLAKQSSGIKRPSMPKDERLATLTDSEYEYTLYTHLSHGNPSAIAAMRGMFNHADPEVVGAGLVNYIVTLVHVYCRAAWAIGSYTLEGRSLSDLRAVLISLYQALGANEDLYSYL